MAKAAPGRAPGPKKVDDGGDEDWTGPIPRSQGLRSGPANATRREEMTARYGAETPARKNYKRGGKVAAKMKRKK